MFFAVYQANSSRSACTRKGHGSNLVHARAFHTGYSQAHWGFSDCCFEVDKDIRQNTLWKTCARWCHHCWTRRNVALSRVKKNKLWIWKAYRRETGELIDWECGGRDKGTLSKLMERLSRWKVELFCTDNWGVYPEVIVADKLYQSKSQTVYLEQNNGRQRHWFARFRRKSIVVSKTLEMVDLTMALFARFHVNGSWKDIASLFSWHPHKLNRRNDKKYTPDALFFCFLLSDFLENRLGWTSYFIFSHWKIPASWLNTSNLLRWNVLSSGYE